MHRDRVVPLRRSLVAIVAAIAIPVNGSETLRVSGFALLRAASADRAPFYDDRVSSQVQAGIDWRPSPRYGAHLHLLGRSDSHGSRRGSAGIVEAYLEGNFPNGEDRLRILAGAFFLPTSRENVDALWESPYAISSSALNSWFGEEFRPIGIDVSYAFRRSLLAGVTLYRGNETFGAFPVDRGWALRDYWALLGEHLPTNEEYRTSVSAENDDRLGWSSRVRWNNRSGSVQLTHIDNRADGLQYGDLLNWDTQFTVLAADLTAGAWTLAGEGGWGETSIELPGHRVTLDIDAAYVLVSRRFAHARATLRQDWFGAASENGRATTLALLWLTPGPWRPGVEIATSEGRERVLIELRYHFTVQ